MHGLQLTPRHRALRTASTVVAVVLLVIALIGSHMRSPRDAQLVANGEQLHYRGVPFTGILYAAHPNHWPQQFALVWRGEKFGAEYLWYANGAVRAMQSYRQGVPHGAWQQWYPDGRVKALRHYVDGASDGQYWTWHANGTVADFRVYDHGRELLYKSFISDGKPFYNYVQRDGERVGVQGGGFCKSRLPPR